MLRVVRRAPNAGSTTPGADAGRCRNLYAFIRLRLGDALSDREVARRWKMEWKSFAAVKHGRRHLPRLPELEALAGLLGVDAAFVFQVARGVPAREVHRLLEENDAGQLARLFLAGLVGGQRKSPTDPATLEEQLRLRNATLKTTFDAVPAACLLFASDGTILLANPQVENACPYSASELLGRNAFEVFGNPGPAACPVTRAFATRRLEQQVSRAVNKRGETVWLHRTAGPVLAPDGAVERVVEILVDVTAQMQGKTSSKLAALRGGLAASVTGSTLPDEEKRRFLRAALELPVQFRAGRRRGRAVSKNLSRGGLFLETDARLPIGTELTLAWTLPGRRASVRARAVVVWKSAAGSPGLGLRFMELSSRVREVLAGCVMDAAKQGPDRVA